MSNQVQTKLKIRAIGIGGAGVAIANMLANANCPHLDIAAIDTDSSSLENCAIENAILIGKTITNGMGSGADATLAKEAAIADISLLKRAIADADIVITIAGLGGGTGSVVSPIISKLAIEAQAKFTMSFSIMPLSIEGSAKSSLAERSVRYLRKVCDAAVRLPNDIILARSNLPIKDAFNEANMYAVNAIVEFSTMLTKAGIVNIDLPSLKKVFHKKECPTFFAIGSARGENCVVEALDALEASPLMESAQGNIMASSLMLSLVCGKDFEMNKMQALLENASARFNVNQRLTFGAIIDESLKDRIKICAMGISDNMEFKPAPRTATIITPVKAKEEKLAPEEEKVEVSNTKPTPIETSPEDCHSAPKPSKKHFKLWGASKKPKEFTANDVPSSLEEQTEFIFVKDDSQRGFFDGTPPNIKNGEDLDVPTFIRRKIKLTL